VLVRQGDGKQPGDFWKSFFGKMGRRVRAGTGGRKQAQRPQRGGTANKKAGNKTGNFAHEWHEWEKCGLRILAAGREIDILQYKKTDVLNCVAHQI
jgi:hypothetical protein